MKKIITTLLVGIFISNFCFSQDDFGLTNIKYPISFISNQNHIVYIIAKNEYSRPYDLDSNKVIFTFLNEKQMISNVKNECYDHYICELVKKTKTKQRSIETYKTLDYSGCECFVSFVYEENEKKILIIYPESIIIYNL